MSESTEFPSHTLGWYRAMTVAAFGADSPAVKFLDKKIAQSPDGPLEPVLADESQMVYALGQMHLFPKDTHIDYERP